MATIRGGVFEGGTTNVDGNFYEKCVFKNTVINYNGGGAPSFINCSFDSCTLGLGGAAANTIGYLSAIYHGFNEWGKGSIEMMFEDIRNNKPAGVTPIPMSRPE